MTWSSNVRSKFTYVFCPWQVYNFLFYFSGDFVSVEGSRPTGYAYMRYVETSHTMSKKTEVETLENMRKEYPDLH